MSGTEDLQSIYRHKRIYNLLLLQILLESLFFLTMANVQWFDVSWILGEEFGIPRFESQAVEVICRTMCSPQFPRKLLTAMPIPLVEKVLQGNIVAESESEVYNFILHVCKCNKNEEDTSIVINDVTMVSCRKRRYWTHSSIIWNCAKRLPMIQQDSWTASVSLIWPFMI